MKVAVKDANILMDLANCDLVGVCLRLPYEFVTTQSVIDELRVEEQWVAVEPFVKSGSLAIVSLSGKELAKVAADPLYERLGQADTEALFVAKREKGILLTGDLTLRKLSENRGIEVHGLLWILDALIAAKCLGSSTF